MGDGHCKDTTPRPKSSAPQSGEKSSHQSGDSFKDGIVAPQSGGSSDEEGIFDTVKPLLVVALCSVLVCMCCYRRKLKDRGFDIMSYQRSRSDYPDVYGRNYFRDDGI